MKTMAASLSLLLASSFLPLCAASYSYVPSSAKPPAIRREFRGAWVATVGNIDWPSKPGLSSDQQKAELLAILDRAAYLRLNAIIFQVRPACDTFYASRLEPWSEYLTGVMGQPPNPPYDPLAFAVEQAHQRGLELHAWFNPYRARTPSAKSPVAPKHVSKMQPELVKKYGGYLWLDPGEKKVQDHILSVMLDVVRRYDIDGVQIDDYFYPSPEKNASGNFLPFPDWGSWSRYQAAKGKLSREDWRRQNVDSLVQRIYQGIKKEKPFVKFGISPSGIWRPGYPPQIRGWDPYAAIYADSRKWFMNGWLDYFAPQLYWEIAAPAQSYPALLNWWADQNASQRHLWPGNAVSRLASGRTATEIVNQIQLTRKQSDASGNILWNFKPLLQNRSNITEALRNELYAEQALIPASPWLDTIPPEQPKLSWSAGAGGPAFSWVRTGAEDARLWVLQTKRGKEWNLEILPGYQNSRSWPVSSAPQVIALRAVDRCGNASIPSVLEYRADSTGHAN